MKVFFLSAGSGQPARRRLFFKLTKTAVLTFSVLLIISSYAFSFGDKKKNSNSSHARQDGLEWKLDATVNNVSFYHALSECDGKKIAFLKFVNKNNYAVNVSWKEALKTQLREEETAFRGEQHLSLPPGETKESNCAGASCKACVLLTDGVSPAYGAQILAYSFKDISVVK